ncbi:hypothetical protein [Sinomonas mesophila]|uniref:hypothetical protein n=1 Tax=Sinomonas mesophila TaxID=1531955 RepID=UPI00098663F0|nr:hypothetical protein [Sinomonas mesophila]
MAVSAVLTNPHVADRLSATDVASLDLAHDPELAELLAAAPQMARALNAILNLDLDESARRLIRREIHETLR